MIYIFGLIPAFIISRVLFWFLRAWPDGFYKILLVHLIALVIASYFGGQGLADHGLRMDLLSSAKVFIFPQAACMVVDTILLYFGRPPLFVMRKKSD